MDELTEKVAYWQRRYQNAVSEKEEEESSRRKQSSDTPAERDDLALRKLEAIEQRLASLNVALSPEKESSRRPRHRDTAAGEAQVDEGVQEEEQAKEQEDEDRVDTEKLLEGDSESFEHKLENYQKHKGKSDDLLRKLTEKILQKDELQNSHIISMFKLDQIDLDDKPKEYQNLLKAMGALYYANRHAKLVARAFATWKARLQEQLQRENGAEPIEEGKEPEADAEARESEELVPPPRNTEENVVEEPDQDQNQDQEPSQQKEAGVPGESTEERDQGPQPDENAEAGEEEEEGKEKGKGRPAIEINTDLANKEGGMEANEQMINEMQINTNKEPSNVGPEVELLHRKSGERPEDSAEQQPIHITETYDANNNVGDSATGRGEEKKGSESGAGKDQSKDLPPQDSKAESGIVPKSLVIGAEGISGERKKVRLEDIDENDLKDLVTQLRENLIEELRAEMEQQVHDENPANKENVAESEHAPEDVDKVEEEQKKGEEEVSPPEPEGPPSAAQALTGSAGKEKSDAKSKGTSPSKELVTIRETYESVMKQIADYMFFIFNRCVKYSKAKHTYGLFNIGRIENRCLCLWTT